MESNEQNQVVESSKTDKQPGSGPSTTGPSQEKATNTTLTPTGKATLKVLAILLIIAGLVIGAFIGFAIAFGGCYKQSCSTFEQNAVLILPLASLLITISLAALAFKKK
jgi:hypothetical protein